jgi:large subunit ribosomal protein L7/L12
MAIKVEDFIKELKEMKVQDLNELVKAIEEEFGVTAAAPVAAAGAGAADEGSSEKTVVLAATGGNKMAVIKLVKEILGLGLMESKQFAETAGSVIKENASAEEAEELKAKFEEAGATIELK